MLARFGVPVRAFSTNLGRQALEHIRVLDLSRVLAGPWSTQLLADLGADVIKVENPNRGDDTRQWGPPYLKDKETGENCVGESAYFHCCNRNKRSVAVDFRTKEGQDIIKKLVLKSDIVVENFKVGKLAEYGLSYADLREVKPDIIYLSITGFGQEGPRSSQPGYDFALQAMGGLMSVTGEPSGPPVKVGVAITDLMTGMYGTVGLLAALENRNKTGEGQHIDISLMDVQVAYLANQAMNYLVSGDVPARMGNAHPNVSPYDVLPTQDGYFVLAVGNDLQFQKLCVALKLPDLATDARFTTNALRTKNRVLLIPILTEVLLTQDTQHWLGLLREHNVPASPVNNIAQAFADPHCHHKGTVQQMSHPRAGSVPTVRNPLRMSGTPLHAPTASPGLGQHTEQILRDLD